MFPIFEIVKTLLGFGQGWVERREARATVKLESETKVAVARAEAEVARLNKSQDAEIAWDQEVAQQMEHSWKDEYWTILLSLPLMLAFMGDWGRAYAFNGFIALSHVPEWYMYSVGLAIASSFGYRALVTMFKKKP